MSCVLGATDAIHSPHREIIISQEYSAGPVTPNTLTSSALIEWFCRVLDRIGYAGPGGVRGHAKVRSGIFETCRRSASAGPFRCGKSPIHAQTDGAITAAGIDALFAAAKDALTPDLRKTLIATVAELIEADGAEASEKALLEKIRRALG